MKHLYRECLVAELQLQLRLASILAPDIATDLSNIANISNFFVSFLQSHKL